MNLLTRFLQTACLGFLGIALISGCYDPTADSVDAQAAAAKAEQDVIVENTDVVVSLTGDNCDIKWTGSNSVGMTPYGYFYELTGKLLLDGESKALKHFEVDIEMDGVKAMNETLTNKLKTKGFFQVDEYPQSKFVATSISDQAREQDPEGTTHVIEGNFQLRDVTKSITFPVKIDVAKNTVTLSSEFKINRKDFGVVYSVAAEDALIRDDVLINLDIEAVLE